MREEDGQGRGRGAIRITMVTDGRGRTILVLGESPHPGYRRLAGELATLPEGASVLVVTPLHPDRALARLGMSKEAGGRVPEFIWLSRAQGGVNPARLDYDVLGALTGFLKRHKGNGSIVCLDSLEVLNNICGFNALARFVKQACDIAAGNGTSLIATANPRAFDGPDLSVLSSAFDYVDRGPVGARVVTGPPEGGPAEGRTFLFRDRGQFEGMLARIKGQVILLTSDRPGKARDRWGLTGPIVWFTETKGQGQGQGPVGWGAGEAGTGVRAVHPANAPVEGMQSIARFLSEDRVTGERRTVVLDGLGYLLLFMDFPKTMMFVKSVADACVVSGAGLVVHMDPHAIGPKEEVVIHRLVDEVIG